MVRLEEYKHETENKAIEKLPLPARAYIPLSQHLGKICEPQVEVGDSVLTGQKIASTQAHVFANIHASVSGKVAAIQDWPHPVLGRCLAIVIESDGQDKTQNPEPRTQNLVESLTAEEIRKIVFEAGIVGMGGASFPSHIKLAPPKPVETLIVNGAECEPYLTGDSRLMVEKAREIILGAGLAAKCTGAKKVYVAIEDNKPEAIESIRLVLGSRFSVLGPEPRLIVLKSQYPQGGEKQLCQNVLKKEVPSGKLPFDIGVMVHNVATLFAVYEAVYLGKPLYERVVTVAGDCLQNPGNFLVRIGTPIKDLIERCGPLKKEPQALLCGGPMMGLTQYSQEAPIIKSSNGVILLSKERFREAHDAVCIRCGRCVEYCPAGLRPCLISLASEKEKWDLAKAHGCFDCIECGLCSYICPQRINLVQAIKHAKARAPR